MQPMAERPKIRTIVPPADPPLGVTFWDMLTARQKQQFSEGFRTIEAALLARFPEGHRSFLLGRSQELSNANQFERQTNEVSCGYHTIANALRVIDGVLPHFSKTGLQAAISQIQGFPADEQFHWFSVYDLLRHPNFSRFEIKPTNYYAGGGMRVLIEDLGKGEVGLWNGQPSPVAAFSRTGFTHLRAIVGF